MDCISQPDAFLNENGLAIEEIMRLAVAHPGVDQLPPYGAQPHAPAAPAPAQPGTATPTSAGSVCTSLHAAPEPAPVPIPPAQAPDAVPEPQVGNWNLLVVRQQINELSAALTRVAMSVERTHATTERLHERVKRAHQRIVDREWDIMEDLSRLTLRALKTQDEPRIGDPTYPRKLLDLAFPPVQLPQEMEDRINKLITEVVDHWSTAKGNPTTLRHYVLSRLPHPASVEPRPIPSQETTEAGPSQVQPNNITTQRSGTSPTTSPDGRQSTPRTTLRCATPPPGHSRPSSRSSVVSLRETFSLSRFRTRRSSKEKGKERATEEES
ncbi:hypothetical protein B0J17DRAFT_686212, partial [Rhizoctonia solani]